MVWVRPARMKLGTSDEKWINNLCCSHETEIDFTLSDGYWLSQYPISISQYKALIEDKYDQLEAIKQEIWFKNLEASINKQVENNGTKDIDSKEIAAILNWYEAVIWCYILNLKLEAFIPKGYYLMMPTEIHWEMGFKTKPSAFDNEELLLEIMRNRVNGIIDELEAERQRKQLIPTPIEKQELRFYEYNHGYNSNEWCFEPFHDRPENEHIIDWGDDYDKYFIGAHHYTRLAHTPQRTALRNYPDVDDQQSLRLCLRKIHDLDFKEGQFTLTEERKKWQAFLPQLLTFMQKQVGLTLGLPSVLIAKATVYYDNRKKSLSSMQGIKEQCATRMDNSKKRMEGAHNQTIQEKYNKDKQEYESIVKWMGYHQFQTFSLMINYLIDDLKNLIAEDSLIYQNENLKDDAQTFYLSLHTIYQLILAEANAQQWNQDALKDVEDLLHQVKQKLEEK